MIFYLFHAPKKKVRRQCPLFAGYLKWHPKATEYEVPRPTFLRSFLSKREFQAKRDISVMIETIS